MLEGNLTQNFEAADVLQNSSWPVPSDDTNKYFGKWKREINLHYKSKKMWKRWECSHFPPKAVSHSFTNSQNLATKRNVQLCIALIHDHICNKFWTA